MANNKTIGLIFGVLGGASLDGHSGREIKKNIHEICKKLSGPEGKKYTGIEFHASQSSLTKLRADVENALKNIQVNVNTNANGGGSVGKGGGGVNPYSSALKQYRSYLQARVQLSKALSEPERSYWEGEKSRNLQGYLHAH